MRRSSAGSPTLSAAAGVTRPEGGAGGVKMTKKVKARQDQKKKKKKKSLGPLHTVGCKVYHRIFHIFRFLYLKLTISFSVSIILSTTFKDISERSLHCRLTIHCHVKTFLELINWKMLRLS